MFSKTSRIFVFLLLICLFGCSSSKKSVEIAVDPLWYPLELMGRENNVLGFSTDLLKAISQAESINLSLISTNWDTLLQGLQQKKYEAILTSIYPYNFNENIYDFSHIYLQTGPVLIVPMGSSATDLSKLSGKEVGTLKNTTASLIVEKHPSIILRSYDSIPNMLNDLTSGALDGVVLPILIAEAFEQDLYHGQLKIATEPLNDDGIRLVTLKNEEKGLIKVFNKGLLSLQKNGEYERLLIKWSLGAPSS